MRRAEGGSDWSTTDYLLADLWATWTGEQHPARPGAKPKDDVSARVKQLREQKKRLSAQREDRRA